MADESKKVLLEAVTELDRTYRQTVFDKYVWARRVKRYEYNAALINLLIKHNCCPPDCDSRFRELWRKAYDLVGAEGSQVRYYTKGLILWQIVENKIKSRGRWSIYQSLCREFVEGLKMGGTAKSQCASQPNGP